MKRRLLHLAQKTYLVPECKTDEVNFKSFDTWDDSSRLRTSPGSFVSSEKGRASLSELAQRGQETVSEPGVTYSIILSSQYKVLGQMKKTSYVVATFRVFLVWSP